jgi:hypothetical protein
MKTIGVLVLSVVAACVGDSNSDDAGGTDAAKNDATVEAASDAGQQDVKPSDAAAEAEAEPPCAQWDAAIALPDQSGVQCSTDGGQAFCFAGLAECCATDAGVMSCTSKQGGCGTEKAFPCDKSSDCDGGICCVKNPVGSNACANRVWSDEGTYCATACPASDITVCNAGETFCGSKTCIELELVQTPGKIISGCR